MTKEGRSEFTSEQNAAFMLQALTQAYKAFDADEVPVGAVIVDSQGRVIARAYNQVEKKQTQTAHAELLVLAEAGKKYGWRLEGCWMYVTLEPCAMCINAIRFSRMAGIIFGARSPLFGYQLDKNIDLPLDQLPIVVKAGVCAHQSAQVLKKFFRQKRREHGDFSRAKKTVE